MRKYIAIVDTETTVKGQQVFDIGMIIADTDGNVIMEQSFLIRETFFTKLFYENKREMYLERLDNPDYPTKLVPMKQAMKEIQNTLDFFRVKECYAYNAKFDSRVIEKLCKKLDILNPFNVNGRVWECLWFWSTQTFMQNKDYGKFCIEHKHLTPTGNYKTSAETAFAYLQKVPMFEEEHTGLEDCKIELQIYLACKKQHKFRAKGLCSNPWILVQPQENIDRLPAQFRSMKINLSMRVSEEQEIQRAAQLIKILGKNLDVEIDLEMS